MKKGKMFILSGPSGVGKGTIKDKVLEQSTGSLNYSISMTTRKPRVGEIEGQHYYFVSVDQFKNEIEDGNLFEWAQYSDNYYGTPAAPIYAQLDKGQNVFLEIETQGALQIKEKNKDAFLIFVMPPSIEILRKRLIGRKTETEEAINMRLEMMTRELQTIDKYDYIVVNDDLEEAVEKVIKVINR